jgi:hypothetical protein
MARGRNDGAYRKSALEDGYSCVGRRPRGAAPGSGFMSEEDAESFEDMADVMAEFGGRSALRSLRQRDAYDDYD